MPELRKANAHLQLIREINDSGDQFPSEPIHGHSKKAIDEWDNTDCERSFIGFLFSPVERLERCWHLTV